MPCLPRHLHFEVCKILRLPQNLHFRTHKTRCLPQNSRFLVHKVLHPPPNLPRICHESHRTRAKVCCNKFHRKDQDAKTQLSLQTSADS